MLTESVATALLQASITGAGLVLAVYALVLPYANRILRARSLVVQRKMSDFKEAVNRADVTTPDKEMARFENLVTEIRNAGSLPTHLSAFGISLAFIFYDLAALMSLWWLLDWLKPIFDFWSPVFFGIATIAFLGIGILSVKDIHTLLTEEFKALKKQPS
jgi:hypothetical protein